MATVWLSSIGTLRICPLNEKKVTISCRKEEQLDRAKNATDLFKSHNEMFSLLSACIDMEPNDFHKVIDWESNVQGWEKQHKVVYSRAVAKMPTTTPWMGSGA